MTWSRILLYASSFVVFTVVLHKILIESIRWGLSYTIKKMDMDLEVIQVCITGFQKFLTKLLEKSASKLFAFISKKFNRELLNFFDSYSTVFKKIVYLPYPHEKFVVTSIIHDHCSSQSVQTERNTAIGSIHHSAMNVGSKKKSFKCPNDQHHRVLRYVLKVGDLEDAVHVFIDLLGMNVFSHVEYDDGSADGKDVHYEGQWSRTLVGYGETEDEQLCLQLTLNHGIARYARGNHFHAIEVQLESTDHLEEAGVYKGTSRGKPTFIMDCDGYNIEVVKSEDGKNRISSIVLNCDEPISLSGPTVRFWTQCLGFEIVCWSADPNNDTDKLIEYTKVLKYRCLCCTVTRKMWKKSIFKPLSENELPYVLIQYGSTNDFHVRLQSLPKGVPMDVGSGKERLVLTCNKDTLADISKRVKTIGKKVGGSESRKSFQLVPGRIDLVGFVATDMSGLEVCFYDDEEIRLIRESQLDAEMTLRKSISLYRKEFERKLNRSSKTVRIHI